MMGILNYLLEVLKHIIGYSFGWIIMRIIFDKNIKNPIDIVVDFISKKRKLISHL